jgi:hypothetical protein
MISKIFGKTSKKIPDHIKSQLLQEFPDAINVDWDEKDDFFEAVFYINGSEYIAKISRDSELTSYQKNLKLDELPDEISSKCHPFGEIMNVIAIHTNKNDLYEVIVRDKDFNRTLLLLSNSGELLNSKRI